MGLPSLSPAQELNGWPIMSCKSPKQFFFSACSFSCEPDAIRCQITPPSFGAAMDDENSYPFRQSSDFWYLTGFQEPDACLLLGQFVNQTFNEPSLGRNLIRFVLA
jgi:hypothetical protein